LILAALVGGWTPSARAQAVPAPAGLNGRTGLDPSTGAPALPAPPAQGAWAEVIMANPKWIVVQNSQGQQFPISSDSIGLFLVRWPTTLDALTQDSIVEAIGPNIGSNTVRTDHIDVFEDTDRALVTPTFKTVQATNGMVTAIDPLSNRFMNGADIGYTNFLPGWSYTTLPNMGQMTAQVHIVGSAANLDPIRVAVPGNNVATIVPMEPGVLSITRVTRGNSRFAEKGDLVYLMPLQMTARTVTLSQLVLYKKVPIQRFRMP
jgi:hypothetical protein